MNIHVFKHKLKVYRHEETMSWSEIKRTRGRRRGSGNHSISVEKICSDAKRRLTEIMMDDTDNLIIKYQIS